MRESVIYQVMFYSSMLLDLEEMLHHADSIDTGNDERNNILFISIRVQKGLTSSSSV
jgi:hypothetical protein